MMTGFGQFGPMAMGGMMTVMKIREGLGTNDYADPGPYQHPPGTVAYEVQSEPASPPARRSENSASRPPANALKVVKPGAIKSSHH
jgi:hypothetical protein